MKRACGILLLFLSACSATPTHCNKGPLWCYSTLGGSDCYAHRVEGWDNRLIGRVTNATYDRPIACEQVIETVEKDSPPSDSQELDEASKIAKIAGIAVTIASIFMLVF